MTRIILIILAIMAIIVVGGDMVKADTTTRICNEAAAVGNLSECYKIQRSLGTEYLCNNAHCWAEIKE